VSCLDPYYGQRSGGGELKRAGCQVVTVTQSGFYISCYVTWELPSGAGIDLARCFRLN
jgi:hypothetical protein